jgi:hypothetical protein
MSGFDRMATRLGILGLSFAICLFITKKYLSYRCFFLLVVMLSLSSFICFYSFYCLTCIVIHVYHAYILDMDLRPSHITHLIFKIRMISTLR